MANRFIMPSSGLKFTKRATAQKDMNPNHDPDNGQFTSGSGVSSGPAEQHMFGNESDFRRINGALRSGEKIPADIAEKIKAIDLDIKNNGVSVPRSVDVVYRGLNIDEESDFLRSPKVGDQFYDPSYVSTSTSEAYARTALKGDIGTRDVLMRITPSRSKHPQALYNKKEHEYLFERGLVFKVNKVTTNPHGETTIDVLMTRYTAHKEREHGKGT